MNKTLKFAVTTIWILLSRGYDAYCTNQFTPDLALEANPLVSVLGFTWTPLLMFIVFFTLYAIYGYYLSVFQPIRMLPNKSGYSFSNIVAYLYLGYQGEWYQTLYKLPNSLHRFNQYMGQILSKCLVFVGILSTVMWLLINNTEWYQTVHSVQLIYAILITGCLVIIYFWNYNKYKSYLSDQAIQ
ncbi:MAG: hypothetical protein AAF599_16950 [Bacteroidota bacterium]